MKTMTFLAFPPILLCAVACNDEKADVKPNIILIVADDLGLGDVSCYGCQTIKTPNIDSLAHNGLMLRNGYSTSATSTPSRYGIFTGVYPWRNPEAKILPGDAPLLIDPQMPTWPKMMQDEGYATAAIGKWHLGMGRGETDWNKPLEPSGNAVGFDYTNLIPATVDRVPTVYVENGLVVGLDPNDPIEVDYNTNFPGEKDALSNPELVELGWHHGHNNSVINGIPRIGFMKGGEKARWNDYEMADYFLGKVKSFIDRNKNRPFFLYYGLHQPHVPRTPATRFAGSTNLGPRGDVILEADWCVGQVMRQLDSLNILDNTIVIFTSDNGAVLQDGYLDQAEELAKEHGHDPKGGLRGGKYSLFDGGTHVPFIIFWKGHIKPAVSDAYLCQADLYPTVGEMLGAQVPDSLDGQSLPKVFLGRDLKKGRQHQILEAKSKLALRNGHYVLIPPYVGKKFHASGNELGNLDHYTLYDLSLDREQRTDIAEKEPELLEKMKSLFTSLAGDYYHSGFEDGKDTERK
ncbi:MAG: sulfatase-like hydrolase/transferase [Candidatus Cryptobacteroides sp.]|jgi:arylsulfatase A-like enzyme